MSFKPGANIIMDWGKVIDFIAGCLPQNPILGPPLPAVFDIKWTEPELKEVAPPIEILKRGVSMKKERALSSMPRDRPDISPLETRVKALPLTSWLPMGPATGLPLPRWTGLKWPWKKA
jgi:hypothetical protein